MMAQQALYPSGTPQPTPPEFANEKFVAKFVGVYATGQPRFTNQFRQIGILASGGSNQSLHMNLQMTLFLENNPTAPLTGDCGALSQERRRNRHAARARPDRDRRPEIWARCRISGLGRSTATAAASISQPVPTASVKGR